MISLHPQILRKDGKEQFVILPYEEYVAVQELLEELEDNRLIDEAKAQDTGEPAVSLEELKRRLDVK
ncbi:MAG: hypothetical protein JWL69_561 [Phycisphaerales bacterium]|nr:hypothetical protein [Phycisphaerales bacterium]